MELGVRAHLLAFLSAMQNEVQMFEIDPDEGLLSDFPDVIEKIEMTIGIVEKMFPMIKVVEEVLTGEISPTLFMYKWIEVEGNFHFPEEDRFSEIGDEVTDLISKAAEKGEQD